MQESPFTNRTGMIDTEDVVHVALVRAIKNLPGFHQREPGGFLYYVRKAIWNEMLNARRKASPLQADGDPKENIQSDEPSPYDNLVTAEEQERFEGALQMLGPIDRDLILGRLESCGAESLRAYLYKRLTAPHSMDSTAMRHVDGLAEEHSNFGTQPFE